MYGRLSRHASHMTVFWMYGTVLNRSVMVWEIELVFDYSLKLMFFHITKNFTKPVCIRFISNWGNNDVLIWKRFPNYQPFWGEYTGHLTGWCFSLLLAWTTYCTSSWVPSDLRCHDAHVTSLQWASYQISKIAGCACAGNAGNVFPRRRFQRKPLVSDLGMHHGTCVTHVPWCMSGSLACGDGDNVPGIPGACAPASLHIWQEAHDGYYSDYSLFPIHHYWIKQGICVIKATVYHYSIDQSTVDWSSDYPLTHSLIHHVTLTHQHQFWSVHRSDVTWVSRRLNSSHNSIACSKLCFGYQ